MNRKKVYLPNSADPNGPESPFYYIDMEDMNLRLMQIANEEVRLSEYQRRTILENIDRNKGLFWEFCGDITFKLERGSEEVSVRFKIRELEHEQRVTVEGKTVKVYESQVTCSWCSSEFDLGRAMVHVQLHQEAVALMGQLTCEFGRMIGRIVEE